MHPQIRQSEPGQCPICGMDLVPVRSAGDGGAYDGPGVVLSKRARTLARLTTTAVRRQSDAAADIRLLGRVEPDETRLKNVTAWTGGRIDKLRVASTGERLRAGQVIASLYSPEVFAAHQDLLVAKQQVTRLAASPESSRNAARAALEAARERLRLLGVPDRQLSQMEGASEPTRSVDIRTPFAGTVIERLATEGAYVATGAPLYRIADLRHLWLQLDAYESDLPRLSTGQTVTVQVEALPGESFEGKVTFIDPTLDATRRTARVRVALDNRDGRLRPGMFAEARVSADVEAGERGPLVVPSSAPLFTGRRAIVYVEKDTAERVAYEPRTVRLGPRLGNYYPVVAGLSEGERVVSRGAFAVDADLQIRGGASMMTVPDDRQEGQWDSAVELPAAERKRLSPVVEAYLALQRALAADDLAGAKAAAVELQQAAVGVKLERPQAALAAWRELSMPITAHAKHVAHAADLEGARTGFEALSHALAGLLQRFGNPLSEPVQLAFCPMAMGSEGASWFQQGQEIDNAYFGAQMRSCGEVQQSLSPGAYLTSPDQSATKAAHPAAAGHKH